MQEEKNKIEAILFTTGRFMTLQEISEFCEIGSVGFIKELLQELKKEYDDKGGSLEIFEEGGKYKLSIKKKYNYLTTKLLDVAEMDKPTQETLAVIAYKQPAIQSDVIKIRGNKAYDHISVLKELGFVVSEKYGRTRLIKLTQKFFDYFDLVEDQLKEKFSNMVKLEEETRQLEKQLEEQSKDSQDNSEEETEPSGSLDDSERTLNEQKITSDNLNPEDLNLNVQNNHKVLGSLNKIEDEQMQVKEMAESLNDSPERTEEEEPLLEENQGSLGETTSAQREEPKKRKEYLD